MAYPKRLIPSLLHCRFRAPVWCLRSASRQAGQRRDLAPAALAQELRHRPMSRDVS
jgi:hypothetical protein